MKTKTMKKVLAGALGMSMVMNMSIVTFAEETSVTAPIYSFDVTQVVVPTTYAVAFNPEGLTVKNGTADSTNQILSKNYGIINKSNKDKVITVNLKVEDQNSNSGITFVNTAAEVTNAKDGEYKIHLTAIPADATEVKVGASGTSADKDTAADALNEVSMTAAAAGKEVALSAGDNEISFLLDKATYSPKVGSEVTLGTSNSNDVKDNFEITSLASAGKGITAFTFGGEMNAKADWTKMASGIKITAIYSNEAAPSGVTPIAGTGSMVDLSSLKPEFTASSSAVGVITVAANKKGSGSYEIKNILKAEMANASGTGDGLEQTEWWTKGTITEDTTNGITITLDSSFLQYYDEAHSTVTITYESTTGETRIAKVKNLKLQ